MAMMGVSASSRPRALLENLSGTTTSGVGTRTLARAEIESKLVQWAQQYGDHYLYELMDQAAAISRTLDRVGEWDRLNEMILGLLGTGPSESLTSPAAKAKAKGVPYDESRVALFQRLYTYLVDNPMPARRATVSGRSAAHHAAFLDSYFSNFIEGAEFDVKEAYEIVFNGFVPPNRSADAYDLTGVYSLLVDSDEMRRRPTSAEELIDILKSRHATIMAGRPEKNPGEFKSLVNRAGHTVFVEPSLVVGTLTKGIELHRALDTAQARAAFMMFLVAEVHPFDDGNGRLARIMMNSELLADGQFGIIIPTVYGEDYLLAIRRLSRAADPDAFVRMLGRAHQYSASIPFRGYEEAVDYLEESNAFDVSSGKILMFEK